MSIHLEGIQLDCHDGTLIVTPSGDLSEFRLVTFEKEIEAAVEQFEGDTVIRNVVIDLKESDYFGSSAIGHFVRMWKHLREHGGLLALCNVSSHEKEILKFTKLESIWSIYDNLEDALAAISKS